MSVIIIPAAVRKRMMKSIVIDSIAHSNKCRVVVWAKPPLEPSELRWGFRGIICVALAVQVKQEPCQWGLVLTFYGFSTG
jgi:hypothetical protein